MNEKNDEKNDEIDKKDINKHSDKSNRSNILKEKEKFYEKEEVSQEVKEVLDEIFTDMIKNDDVEIEFKEIDYESEETEIESSNMGTDSNEKQDYDFIVEKDQVDTKTFNNIEQIMEIDDYKTAEKSKGLETEELQGSLESSLEGLNKEDFNNVDHKLALVNELESFHEKKIKELGEKIKENNERYSKLEEKINEYDEKNYELIEKRKELEERVKEFEDKSKELEESKNEFKQRIEQLEESRNEFTERNEKLQDAREQFVNLSKQVENKKIGLDKIEIKLDKLQKSLEKSKYSIEKNKIELEREKLEFEMERADIESRAKELDITEYEKVVKHEESEEIIPEKKGDVKGKAEILQDLLQELSYEGNFQSCFLIDGKGMLISEYSNAKLDTVAIGAMFSLVCTTLLRTVKGLNLYELEYFKMASTNGEFLLKNINILNYERNFVLLAYYDGSNLFIPSMKQKFNKKVIKKIFKSVENDFNEYGKETKISWVFDNLTNKVDFLKQKYEMPEGDIETIRINLLNNASIKIRELFEF